MAAWVRKADQRLTSARAVACRLAGTGLGKNTENGGGFRTPSATNLDAKNGDAAPARLEVPGDVLQLRLLPGKYRLCDRAARLRLKERQVWYQQQPGLYDLDGPPIQAVHAREGQLGEQCVGCDPGASFTTDRRGPQSVRGGLPQSAGVRNGGKRRP